jgi:hypothetical protein
LPYKIVIVDDVMLIGSILLNIWYQIGSSQMEDISSLEIFIFLQYVIHSNWHYLFFCNYL